MQVDYLTFAILIHWLSVSVYLTCTEEGGWITFYLWQSRVHPVTACTCCKKVHAKIFAQTDLVIRFGPKGNTSVRTEVTQHFNNSHESSWLGKSEITTFRVSMPDHNGLISGNSLVFRATILILCLFVSIHGNMNKQTKTTVPGSVMSPLCHLPYKFYSLCSCMFLLLLCPAWVYVLFSVAGEVWPQSQWHFGKAQQYRVQSSECLREHSWSGTVPSCQMLVKNSHVTQPVGETNVWTLGQMYAVLQINMRYCFCPEQSLLIIYKQQCCEFWVDSALNNDMWWLVEQLSGLA